MYRRLAAAALVAAAVSGAGIATRVIQAESACAMLSGIKLEDTTISLAEVVSDGRFTPAGQTPIMGLPPFCRVVAVTKPSVNFEVWLPQTGWNGKFQGVGNGGMAGVISYAAMGAALKRGYAVASTDTGHVSKGSFDASWALNRPDLIADFGHRGLHVTTENGKRITEAFYQKPASH